MKALGGLNPTSVQVMRSEIAAKIIDPEVLGRKTLARMW